MDNPIRVFIVNWAHFVGDSFRLLLHDQERLVLVGSSATLLEFLALLKGNVVDVVLVHATEDAAAVVRAIKSHRPDQQVIVVGLEDRVENVLRIVEAGASGYLLEGSNLNDVAHAVEAVYKGQPLCSPRIIAAMFRAYALQPA